MEGGRGAEGTTTLKRSCVLPSDEDFDFDFKLGDIRHIVTIHRDRWWRPNDPVVRIDDQVVGRLRLPVGRTLRTEAEFDDLSDRLVIVVELVLPGKDLRIEPFVDGVSLVSERKLEDDRALATYEVSFMDRYAESGVRSIWGSAVSPDDLVGCLVWPFVIVAFIVGLLLCLVVLDLVAVFVAWFVATAGLLSRVALRRRRPSGRELVSLLLLVVVVTAPAAIAWIVRHH